MTANCLHGLCVIMHELNRLQKMYKFVLPSKRTKHVSLKERGEMDDFERKSANRYSSLL